jgi:hypothetical protein
LERGDALIPISLEVLGEIDLEPARRECLDARAAGAEDLPVGILAVVVGAKRNVPAVPQRLADDDAGGDCAERCKARIRGVILALDKPRGNGGFIQKSAEVWV